MDYVELQLSARGLTLRELLERVVDEYHRNPMRQARDHVILQEVERRLGACNEPRRGDQTDLYYGI